MGLANRGIPGDRMLEETVAYAQDLADHISPWSTAQIKQQVRKDMEREFVAAARHADVLMLESFASSDVREGVQSYFENRPPAFPPLAARS